MFVIACIVIPGFELRAALRERPRLQTEPAALAPEPGTEALLGPVTAVAEAAGIRTGMRLGEALATCPSLQLVDPDPAAAEEAWEQIVRRLEDAGIAVDPAAPGCAYFEPRGVERLYGGLEPALKRALKAVGPGWDARVGAARRRFAALAAANVARSGQVLIVSDEHTREFLSPLPLTLIPMEAGRREELQELGITKLGELAGLPGGAVAERLGPDGRRAWSLARGGSSRRVRGRKPAAELLETLEFPEAVGNELTLRRSLGVLLDRLLARPERGGRALRKLALAARLVGGGSWRRTITLRDATAEPARLLHDRATPDMPAPVVARRAGVPSPGGICGSQLGHSPKRRSCVPTGAKGCVGSRRYRQVPSAPSSRSLRGHACRNSERSGSARRLK
jgi:protein ImuB